ncbi:MAG: hypothetical protein IPI85_13995 [Dehalococcoidia bacterium]|nr:hypothetical protein [Dehalococcoidia bacterium]
MDRHGVERTGEDAGGRGGLAPGDGTACLQGERDGSADGTANGAFIAKANLRLRRVDVDIDVLIRDGDVDGGDGESGDRELGLVGIDEGEGERATLDPTAVHEERDRGAVAAVNRRRTADTGNADATVAEVDVEHRCGGLGPIDGSERVADVAVAAGGEGTAAAGDDMEGDAGIGERIVGGEHHNLAPFAARRAEELAPGGNTQEKVPDGDRGAARGWPRGPPDDPAFNQGGGDAHRLGLDAGDNLEVRGGGDGGEGFAAEAESVDVAEVVEIGDLRGGMAFEGEFEFFRLNTAAVISDADEGKATFFDFEGDAGGARIDGVIQQFPDDGNGAFDDLPGGDAGGDFGREDADHGAGGHSRHS